MAPGPRCFGNSCTYTYLDRDFVPDAPMDLVLHQLPWVPDPADECCMPVCKPETGGWEETVEMCGGIRLGVDGVLDLTEWNGVITVDVDDLKNRETIFALYDGEAGPLWDGCGCGYEITRSMYAKNLKVDLDARGTMNVALEDGELVVDGWFDTSYEVTSNTCLGVLCEGPMYLVTDTDPEFPNANTTSGGRLHFGTGGRVTDTNGRASVQAPAGHTLRYRLVGVVSATATNGALVECDGLGVAITLPTSTDQHVDVTATTATETRRVRIQVCPAIT